jgi:hypothetical protein
LMASDYRAVREKVMTRFPIMCSNAVERRMLFQRSAERLSLVTDAKVAPLERVQVAQSS